MSSFAWGGARSIASFAGDGWFTFHVPVNVAGVVIGLNNSDLSPAPSDIPYAFHLHDGGTCSVVSHNGGTVAEAGLFTSDTVFHVVRIGSTLYFTLGNTTTEVSAGVVIPGTVVYSVASVTQLDGPVFLDASLLAPGDRVQDISMTELSDFVGAAISFEEMTLNASGEGVEASAALSFEPMTVESGPLPNSSSIYALLSFEPMVVLAYQDNYAEALISFEPMELTTEIGNYVAISFEAPNAQAHETNFARANLSMEPLSVAAFTDGIEGILNGVNVSMSPMAMFSSGYDDFETTVILEMMPLEMVASETDYAEVVVSMPGMFMYAQGETILPGPIFTVYLPAMSGVAPTEPEITDTATADDYTESSSFVMVTDTATADDATLPDSEQADLVTDATPVYDYAFLGMTLLAIDDADADEVVLLDNTHELSDTATASEVLFEVGETVESASDTANADDAVFESFSLLVLDTGTADDVQYILDSQLLIDTATADEVLFESSEVESARNEFTDTATADDTQTFQIAALAWFEDTATADDATFYTDPSLTAWVMNAETGAVSWYANWGFTDMVVVGDKVLAVGPSGLAVVQGNTDDGAPINAAVMYGFSELGGFDQDGNPKADEFKKRVASLWFGYQSTGAMRATVETYGQGYGVQTYSMVQRAAGQPRGNRIVPGKGLNSRYWRVGIENVAGCAFEVSSISADIAPSTRRI